MLHLSRLISALPSFITMHFVECSCGFFGCQFVPRDDDRHAAPVMTATEPVCWIFMYGQLSQTSMLLTHDRNQFWSRPSCSSVGLKVRKMYTLKTLFQCNLQGLSDEYVRHFQNEDFVVGRKSEAHLTKSFAARSHCKRTSGAGRQLQDQQQLHHQGHQPCTACWHSS